MEAEALVERNNQDGLAVPVLMEPLMVGQELYGR